MKRVKIIKIGKLEPSIIIAFLAVLISLGSTYFSYRETTLIEQQKEASVWPYLENRRSFRTEDSTIVFSFIVINKGVGPAIINDVDYIFDGDRIENWGLGKSLAKKFPNINISQYYNSTLENRVIASREVDTILKVRFSSKIDNDTTSLWKTAQGFKYHLEYKYSSVYGQCWEVKDVDSIIKIEDCGIMQNF